MKEREVALQKVWNTDAPNGKAWVCPNCNSWATLGGNAGFHACKTGHCVPVLRDRPKQEEKIADKMVHEWAQRHDLHGTLTDLRAAFEDAASLPKTRTRAEGGTSDARSPEQRKHRGS